jgi:hypothetical protein
MRLNALEADAKDLREADQVSRGDGGERLLDMAGRSNGSRHAFYSAILRRPTPAHSAHRRRCFRQSAIAAIG